MIRRVRVQGYKSLKDVEVALRPLTVFIGPNASGKSNLFDALSLLSRLITMENIDAAFAIHRGAPLDSFFYDADGLKGLLTKGKAQFTLEVDIELPAKALENKPQPSPDQIPLSQQLRYSLTLEIKTLSGEWRILREALFALSPYHPYFVRQQNRLQTGNFAWMNQLVPDRSILTYFIAEIPQIQLFKQELAQWAFYQFEPTAMRNAVPIKKIEHPAMNGSDIVAFFNSLRLNEPQQFRFLERTLKTLFGIEGLEVGPDQQGMLQLRVLERGVPYSVRVVSEGTLRMLGLLAILSPMALAKTTVLGYEEPENGVHPRRLKLIADLLHNAAEANEHLQILINTHSPVLPEYFDPQSLIVCRKEGRESKFIPFSHFQMNGHALDTAFDEDELETTFTQRVIRGDFDV